MGSVVDEDYRTCLRCGEFKPLEAFPWEGDERHPKCRPCHYKPKSKTRPGGHRKKSTRTCVRCRKEFPKEQAATLMGRTCPACISSEAPRRCSKCGEVRPRSAFYRMQRTCRPCKVEATRRSRAEREPKVRKKNQGIQDDYANTWDLGTLSERERVAYLRGIWVGWQRAMGSQSNFGPGDGNLLCSFLAASLKEVEMPDEVKLKCYAAGRRLAIDYLPKPRSATFGGEQAPDREEEAA